MPPTLRALLFLVALSATAQQGWWMTEPIRWVQTNLRQTDASLDAARLASQLSELHANAWLQSMGGIAAYYPTRVPFHFPSPNLPAGRDMFGDSLREAHSRHIRVVGRFDFSKTRREVFDAHPEWFFRQADGQPVVYNGLYSTCINGDYYRRQALLILTEALERYDVDGLFFNMFGNQSRDYAGREVGLCHCDACRRLFRERFQRDIPDKPDDEYRRFMFQSSREVAAAIGDLIHRLRPRAGYFNYIQESTDGIMSESNTAVARPLPLWPYAASLNVNRARNSQPAKMAVDLNMQFVDYWWRWATVPANEISTRAWQQLAHGGALTFEVNGTLDQQDRQALDAIRPIFTWAAANEKYFSGQQSAARVLLLGNTGANESSFRGLFRLLSELHVPFAVSDNLDWLGKRRFDLVVCAGRAPAALKAYLEAGGRLLLASPTPPAFELAPVVRTVPELRGYLRLRDHAAFPSLPRTDLILLDGPFTELAADPAAPLTLIPPSLYAPPEFVHIDIQDTPTPGLALRAIGQGQAAWLPWDVGALYYRQSLPAHSALFADLLRRLLPAPQLTTDAHPLVEITLMHQAGRTLLHLVNLSGHSQTAWFPPVPMRDIHLRLEGEFRQASTVRRPAKLTTSVSSGYTELTLPGLDDYELIVLEPGASRIP